MSFQSLLSQDLLTEGRWLSNDWVKLPNQEDEQKETASFLMTTADINWVLTHSMPGIVLKGFLRTNPLITHKSSRGGFYYDPNLGAEA